MTLLELNTQQANV